MDEPSWGSSQLQSVSGILLDTLLTSRQTNSGMSAWVSACSGWHDEGDTLDVTVVVTSQHRFNVHDCESCTFYTQLNSSNLLQVMDEDQYLT